MRRQIGIAITNRMKTARKLKKWRESNNYNQRVSAKMAGISQAAWQAVESGQSKRIGLQVAAGIVRATDGLVTLDELAGLAKAS